MKTSESKKPLIEYPTVYTFKVMGLQKDGFREYVRRLFKRLMGTEVSPDSISGFLALEVFIALSPS